MISMNVRIFCVAAVLFSGCGDGGGSSVVTAPVSGKVTMDGVPLEGATVNYVTDAFSSSGVTKEDGTYTLPTGAAVGENVVHITKFKAPEGYSDNPEDGLDSGQVEAAIEVINDDEPAPAEKADTGEQIPAEFSDPASTILKMPVPADGKTNADFALTSK
jgi:hypothetical protein